MSLTSFLGELASVSPILRYAAEATIFLLAALVCWLIASIPFGLVFLALKNTLKRASLKGTDFYRARKQSAKTWFTIKLDNIRDEYCSYLKISHQPFEKLLQITKAVGDEITGRNKALLGNIIGLRETLDKFNNRELLDFKLIDLPEQRKFEDDSSKRRSSATLLIIAVPIIIALISINTGLLFKFFEGFIDDYLSYNLGIKLSFVLAFFFSCFELALGIILYYTAKHKSANPFITPMLLTVITLSVLGLGFIEAYLYLNLSAQMARVPIPKISYLTGLEFIDAIWLTPFGFIIVTGLALMGHLLVKGYDDFRDAGQSKDIKEIIKSLKAELQKFKENLETVLKNINISKDSIDGYNKNLLATQDAATKLKEAFETVLLQLTNTITEHSDKYKELWSKKEAKHIFYAHTAYTIAFFVVLIAFTATLGNNLIKIQPFSVPEWMNYCIALMIGFAGLMTGYILYPWLKSLKENSTVSFYTICLLVTALLIGLFMSSSNSLLPFILLVITFSVLAFFGVKLDTYSTVLIILIKMFGCILVGISIWLIGITGLALAGLVMMIYYVLYLVGLPFLFIFRQKDVLAPEVIRE